MTVAKRRALIAGVLAVAVGVWLLILALGPNTPPVNPHAGTALSYIPVNQPHSWFFGYWSRSGEVIATTPILEVPGVGVHVRLVSATSQTDGCPIQVVQSRVYDAEGEQSYVQGSLAPWNANHGLWVGDGVRLSGLRLSHGSPELWYKQSLVGSH